MSSLPYIQQLSKVIVAQITQTIGWNSIQTTPLELLTDILHKYLEEITRQTQRYTELYGRTEPNLDDVALAFSDLNINISDLDEYISNVDPVPCIINVPKFPIPKDSNLNFLKPGSKEVVTRPVHVHEHLPPIFPSEEPSTPPSAYAVENHNATHDNTINEIQTYMSTNQITERTSSEENGLLHDECNIIAETTVIYDQQTVQQDNHNTFKKPIPPHTSSASRPCAAGSTTNGSNPIDKNAVGKETREIISCIMTTSGFISPAREGKLPEAKRPTPIIDDEPEVVIEAVRELTPPPAVEKKHHSNKRDKESKIDNSHEVDAIKSDVKLDEANMNDDNRSEVKLYEVIQSAPECPQQPLKKKAKKSQIDPLLKDQKKQKRIKSLDENQFKSKDELNKFNAADNMLVDGDAYGYGMKRDSMDSSSTQVSEKMKKKSLKVDSLKKKRRKNRDMVTLPYPPNDNPELREKQKKKRISKLSKKNLAAMGLNPNAIEGFAIPSVMDGSQNMSTYDRFAQNPYSMPNQSRLDGAIQPKEGQKKTKQLEKLTNEPNKHKNKFLKKLTSTSSSMCAKSSDEINNRLLSQSHSQFMTPTMDMHDSFNAEHWPIKDTNVDESQKYKPPVHLNTLSPTKKTKTLKKLNKPPKEPKAPKIKKESLSKKARIPKTMDLEMSKSAHELFNSSCSSSQPNQLFLSGMGMLEGIDAPGILPSNPLFQSMRFDFPQSSHPYPGLHGFHLANFQRFSRSNFGDPAQNIDSKYSFANELPQLPTKPLCNVAPLMPPSLLPMEMGSSHRNAAFANLYSDYSQSFEQKLVQDPSNLIAGSSSNKISATSPTSHSNLQLHKDDKSNAFDAPILIDSEDDVKYHSMEQQKSLHSPSQDSQQDTFGGEIKRKKMKDKGSNSKKDKKDKEKKKKDKKDKLKSKKKDKERLKMTNERIVDGSVMNKSIDDQMQTDWSRDVLEQRHETDDMNESTSDATIPKLTLKLAPSSPAPRTSRPSTPDFQNTKKISKKKKKQKRTMEEESDKSQEECDDSMGVMSKMVDGNDNMKRESSPELARISALVTRPPKQKSFTKDNNAVLCVQREHSDDQIFIPQPSTPSGRGRPKGSTSSLKSGKKSSKASRSLAENEAETKTHSVDIQSSVLDVQSNSLHTVDEQTNEENQVWICPACGRVDDGTPMIGCDGCDAWYHWVCVGIQVPPEQDQDWFCRVCISKKQEDKKKKRKKKDKEKH